MSHACDTNNIYWIKFRFAATSNSPELFSADKWPQVPIQREQCKAIVCSSGVSAMLINIFA